VCLCWGVRSSVVVVVVGVCVIVVGWLVGHGVVCLCCGGWWLVVGGVSVLCLCCGVVCHFVLFVLLGCL